ncbi:hypothetical protein Pcinc_002186 [Petrolisthes cinctipes]|uniref:Uncharacterized protein n=1 Tax=Petrolisthes cinctipes TaxID=88211 RepID=A0AAE1GK80_PETCI|nr:hypothetical protein Pcinc_002186 [Petrolisthes cinctipes]
MDTDTNVKALTLRKLSVDLVKKALPYGYNKHFIMSKASSGKQQPLTYIIASVERTLPSRLRNDVPEKRLVLREILQNGVQSDLNLELFVFADIVGVLEKLLEEIQDLKDVLLVLSETRLVPYTGYPQEGWCRLALLAGGRRALNSQLWLVKSSAEAEEQMDVDDGDVPSSPKKSSHVDVLPRHQNKPPGSTTPSLPDSPGRTLLQHQKSPGNAQLHHQKSPGNAQLHHQKSPGNAQLHHQKSPGNAQLHHQKSPGNAQLHHQKSPGNDQLHHQKSPSTSLPQHKNCHDDARPQLHKSPSNFLQCFPISSTDSVLHPQKFPDGTLMQHEKSPVPQSSTSDAMTNGHGHLPHTESFVSINACEPGVEVSVCGVVSKGVAESVGDIRQETGDVRCAVVDPSCLEEGAEYRELVVTGLHSITAGVIMLLRNIQVNYCSFDLHTRVETPGQAITFSSNPSDPIVPSDNNSDFVLTDTVKNKVKEVRTWWKEVAFGPSPSLSVPTTTSTISPATPANEAHTSGTPSMQATPQHPVCSISTIEKETVFAMYCQIVELRSVCEELMTVLRIQDGTVSKAMFLQYNLEEATQELMTQSENYSDIGSAHVDILIISPTQELQSLKEGTIVCLNGVRCNARDAEVGSEAELTLLELYLDASTASIISLNTDHPIASSILRLLHKGESSGKRQSKVCEETEPTSSKKKSRIEAVTTSCVVLNTSNSSDKMPPPATTSTGEQLMTCKSVRKEANEGGKGGGEKESLSHQQSDPGIITTVINGEFGSRTLKQFCESGESGEVYRVEAVVEELLSHSPNQCKLCKEVAFCQHTWVWGVCLECGTTYSGQQLFQSFPCSVLRKAVTLPCISCRESPHDTGGPEGETRRVVSPGTASSVVPMLRLILLLSDPHNTHQRSQFNLTADCADLFFGVKASFQWLECGGREDVRELLKALYSQPGPHTFGLVKRCTSNGATQLDITNTSLSLIQQ